jgi:hypothetical protein
LCGLVEFCGLNPRPIARDLNECGHGRGPRPVGQSRHDAAFAADSSDFYRSTIFQRGNSDTIPSVGRIGLVVGPETVSKATCDNILLSRRPSSFLHFDLGLRAEQAETAQLLPRGAEQDETAQLLPPGRGP